MKTILLWLTLFTVTLTMLFIAMNLLECMDAQDIRIRQVEAEVQALRTEWIGYKAVLWERTEPFKDILPVAGGYVGVRKTPTPTATQPN
jgi:hypothetical protein